MFRGFTGCIGVFPLFSVLESLAKTEQGAETFVLPRLLGNRGIGMVS